MKAVLCSALLLVFCLAFAQQKEGWRNESGYFAPDTDARKSNQGFGGWVFVTSDADWKEKWQTSPDSTPHFTEAHSVSPGNRVYVLTFFANPKLNDAGEADISCDLEVTRPNSTTSSHQENAPCFKGKLKGSPSLTYLAAPVIAFSADPGDPLGEWVVHVKLHDNVRDVAVALKTTFTVMGK